MSNNIVVLGAINNDLIINTPKIPRMGETVSGSGFMRAAGGKGANQAVAAARLGGHVSFIGAVGGDIFGSEMLSSFRNDGIDVSRIKQDPSLPTGTAVIVLHEGDNFIILDAGANASVSESDITEDAIANAGLFITQFEIPYETAVFAIKTAKKHNVKVLLNPAPARRLDDGLLSMIDILTPNETECEIITGLPVKTIDDAKTALRYLTGKGVAQVVITLGDQGSVFNDGTAVIHQPAAAAPQVVDTTAAGDSFTGALAVALTEGKPISDAVSFAARVSAIVVSRLGAQPSLPYRSDIM